MDKKNNSFITLNSTNNIAIIMNTRLHIHAKRLFCHYFSGFNFNIIDVENYKDSKKIVAGARLVIWVSESIESIPNEIIESEKIICDDFPEGAFLLRSIMFHQQAKLLIIGGGIPGIIYAINELGTRHLVMHDQTIKVSSINISQTPALPYRFFWTWDHSTNWYLEQCGMQEIGFANPYSKPKDGFLEDYCRLIDFMSLHRINGITIYGFLRDSHGGIEVAQELCRYATERGVRILPGVGINSYGGIYWEGEHSYNLSHWLRQNPDLRAQFIQSKHFALPEFAELHLPEIFYLDAACPSKSKNMDYHVEAIQWLAETFQIGGINFETGDYGTCQCVDCAARRVDDQQWSLKDMALVYPRLFSAAQKSGKNLWLICDAYWDNLLDRNAIAPLADLPDEAIYQFCFNRSYAQRLINELTSEYVKSLPRTKNIWRTHMGSQWQHERYELVAKRYADMMRLSHQTGLQGANIFGEVSSFSTVNEINYLAFSRFGYDSALNWDQFMKHDLAPLFGGFEEASRYLQLLDCSRTPKALNNAIAEARDISISLSGDSYRRWIWLQNRLHQKLIMNKKY